MGDATLPFCEGFGNCTEDYTAPFGNREASLSAALTRRGFDTHVLPMERGDWFNVAWALLTWQFWAGCCTADQGYLWYLRRVEAEVERVRAATGAPAVQLVGHSAGGWLARAFLGDDRFGAARTGAVRMLVTLGTPHLAPPPGAPDMTRGTLTWLNAAFPGAFYAGSLSYTSVVGRAARGDPTAENVPGRRSLPGYASSSYSQLLGPEGATADGDCVVPCACAALPGSAVVRLDGVFHSMSRVGTFDEDSGIPWYGSEAVVDNWAGALLAELPAASSVV